MLYARIFAPQGFMSTVIFAYPPTKRQLLCALIALVTGCDRTATPAPSNTAETSAAPTTKRADGTCGGVARLERAATWRRGVSLGLFVSDPDEAVQRRIYGELLDEIRAVGATDVQIAVRWAQPNVRASAITADPAVTTPDSMVAWVLDAARERGLRTFLMPILHVEQRRMGEWRGTLIPSEVGAWWASYEAFILHYARLAEAHGVSLFAVGSELLSTEREDMRWRALIARTRAVYSGQLTYSGNWDHFEVPTFWDALDVVGMTAYQELSPDPAPDLAKLKAGWQPFLTRFRAWRVKNPRPVIITEVGYPSHDEGAAYPWDYRARGVADPALQARAYEALAHIWGGDEAIEGIYLWNWFGPRDPADRGYSPRGKPAEQILSCWYAGRPLANTPRTDP
jgi:hypothetical protein